jgi:hypothetical protein
MKPSKSTERKRDFRRGFIERALARFRGEVDVPNTRQNRRHSLFETTFRELQEKHGPEGRRRLRAMARELGHRRYRETPAT